MTPRAARRTQHGLPFHTRRSPTHTCSAPFATQVTRAGPLPLSPQPRPEAAGHTWGLSGRGVPDGFQRDRAGPQPRPCQSLAQRGVVVLPLQGAVTPGWGVCPKYVANHDFQAEFPPPITEGHPLGGMSSQRRTGGQGAGGQRCTPAWPPPRSSVAGPPGGRGSTRPPARQVWGGFPVSVTAPRGSD